MDLAVLGDVVLGLLPTIGVSLLFGIAVWAIVRADASERSERARLEAAEDAAARRPAAQADDDSGAGDGDADVTRG